MADLEVVEKFKNDAVFHNMVVFMEKGLLNKNYTIQDLKEACELVAERYEVRKMMGWIDE